MDYSIDEEYAQQLITKLEHVICQYMQENKINPAIGVTALMSVVISQMAYRGVPKESLIEAFTLYCDNFYIESQEK